MVRAERFHLANGWTVSFSEDTPPSFCNVAAWPTHLGDEKGDPPRNQDLWFDFTRPCDDAAKEPRTCRDRDRRCWSLEDMVEALRLVAATSPQPRTA